jgi:hypothetical protein
MGVSLYDRLAGMHTDFVGFRPLLYTCIILTLQYNQSNFKMIQVLLYPDALSMVGSMNAFEIFSTSKADVVFALRYQGSSENIVQHTYTPNDKNRITLSVKDIILPLLSFEVKDSSEPYVQPHIMKSFVATLYEVGSEDSKKEFTFSVIRAGVDRLSDSATNFLKNNFLTWQPQVKAVTYYSPEFLTYYATAPSVMKCKAYMWNGTAYEEKEVVLMGHMNAGTVYTVPVQYAIIAKKIGGSIQPSYYDIWVEQDGKRVTYVQRYYASDMKSEEEEWFLFENSLGGVDCFRAYGNSENTAEHTHNVAEIEEDSEEYRVDTTRKFKKNTGFLDKKERLWMLDFFPSLGKYVYHGSALRKITVIESDVNYEAKELPSNYTFTYKYSDARPYLNLTRSDASDFKQMDIHLPEIGNFTIAPRLVEFPRQLLSGGVLFPVQEPYSETWGVTTADALFNYVASTLTDRYSGGGGIGHQHFNIEVLNGLSYDYGYILYQGDRIKAGMADDCTPGGALEKKMLRKDIDDTAKGKITFEDVISLLKGLKLGDGKSQITGEGLAKLYAFMTYNFVSGAYGSGASIDNNGDAEMNSLFVRQFISAPKFVFNEISVTKAEQWNTNGYGTIESVDTGKHIISLHLEGNDYGSLQVGDICRGIYADIDNAHGSDKNTEGALDDCNFVLHKGFFTTYFYVKKIITSEKGKFVFEYGKRSEATPDPCAYMDFAQYGSFTDDKRQSSMYFSSRGNSYIEVLDGVCNWEIYTENRVCRYGWLGGLAIKRRDGSYIHPSGNGIFVQDNVYFGGNVEYLGDILGLDDLKNEAKAYDVSLSQYQSVITVDDMGNVINGLYTQDEGKATKQYRISTAVFVRKGMDILLEEDANSEDVTEGHYRLYVVSEDCDVEVKNSTVFIKGIRNIKDGVAGTADDTNFDYAAMRKMSDAMVTIVVDLEGKTSKTVQMPIRIQHDSLPFMVCDLSNESASVAWNTRAGKYIGFPIKTKVSLMYHNEPWAISSLNISSVAGLKTSMSIDGKAKIITIDADNLTADTLDQVTKLDITVVGKYAGASYEYTRELTILKSSDTVVYELIPSADSIIVDKDGNTTVNSVSCDAYATSSDDKRYKLTTLPVGMSLKYGKDENATKDLALGAGVDVTSDDKMVTFALYDKNNQMLDKESVPVLAYGKDGKGIEYIFKLQDTAPSNPTPSDFATNKEYQRTDKEFVPSGWTDDPTGVDAVNQYEWVCKRVSTNGHWEAFSKPAEYAHFGKHAAKATSTDDIVTIPTDSKGKVLVTFREDIYFSLRVDGKTCKISSVVGDRAATTDDVSYSISGNTASISCAKDANIGMDAQTIVFKVTGTLDDGSTYIDYVTVKIVPNVTGTDGRGYEYVYYLSDQSESNFITQPYRLHGVLQPMGWQDDPMEPTQEKQYVYVAYKTGDVGADGNFSEPKLFNRYPKSISSIETWYYAGDSSDVNRNPTLFREHGSKDFSQITFDDVTPWLWIMKITWFTDGDEIITFSCGGYKAKDGEDGNGLIVGYQSSASEPSVLPTPKTLADYDKAQDDIGSGWTKTAPATGDKSIVLGGKITTDEIIDRYNSSTSAWGTEESEILLDGIKQKKTFYKTPSSLGDNGKCIRRIKVVNHFRDSYLRVMLKSYSEANWDLVCISRLYLPSEVINSEGNQIKEDSEYLNRSKHAYVVSGDGQSLVAELSMPDAGEYYFFIGYFKDGGTDSYGDYGLFAWQSMIALTESLWRTDGTVDAVGNITWSKAMPMQAEAIVMERAYIATPNDTVSPSKPYRTNGILQGGWTAKRLAVSSVNRFIWESVRAGKHGTDSVQDDWSQPVIVANFAEAGKMGKNGCIVRNSEGWKSGATYHNDSALTLEQKYIDLIYIEDNNANDGWSVYQCNVTHTATGSSFDPSATDSDGNRLWIKLSDAGPMYSPLIVGKNAVLKFAQGQQFNLMEGNNIFGSFRWVKNDADYAFWIGGTEGSTATTSITRGGKLKTTDADITGKITATSGKIGGLNITENGLGIGVYGQFDLRIGTALEHSSFWNGYYNNGYGEVCVGKAALINPFTDYWQTACDMYGDRASGQTGSSNVNNATMIVRKITKGSNMGSTVSAVNNVFDPAYAALNVDTDEGIGIRSIGGNLLGCIAQNVIRTDSVTQKEQTAIDNNRVGILVMVNSSEVNVKLPKTPMVGQMLIVVQGNSRIYFDPVVSGRRLYCCGKIHTTSDKFYSDDVGQFNILIWDGYYWQLQYIYH